MPRKNRWAARHPNTSVPKSSSAQTQCSNFQIRRLPRCNSGCIAVSAATQVHSTKTHQACVRRLSPVTAKESKKPNRKCPARACLTCPCKPALKIKCRNGRRDLHGNLNDEFKTQRVHLANEGTALKQQIRARASCEQGHDVPCSK